MGLCSSSPSSKYVAPAETGFDGKGHMGSAASLLRDMYGSRLVRDLNVSSHRPSENEMAESADLADAEQVKVRASLVVTRADLKDYKPLDAFTNVMMDVKVRLRLGLSLVLRLVLRAGAVLFCFALRIGGRGPSSVAAALAYSAEKQTPTHPIHSPTHSPTLPLEPPFLHLTRLSLTSPAAPRTQSLKVFDREVKTTLGYRMAERGLTFATTEKLEDNVFLTVPQQVLEVSESETQSLRRCFVVVGSAVGGLLQRAYRVGVVLFKEARTPRPSSSAADGAAYAREAGSLEIICTVSQVGGTYEALAGVAVPTGEGGNAEAGGGEERHAITARFCQEMADAAVARLRGSVFGSKDDDDGMRPMSPR